MIAIPRDSAYHPENMRTDGRPLVKLVSEHTEKSSELWSEKITKLLDTAQRMNPNLDDAILDQELIENLEGHCLMLGNYKKTLALTIGAKQSRSAIRTQIINIMNRNMDIDKACKKLIGNIQTEFNRRIEQIPKTENYGIENLLSEEGEVRQEIKIKFVNFIDFVDRLLGNEGRSDTGAPNNDPRTFINKVLLKPSLISENQKADGTNTAINYFRTDMTNLIHQSQAYIQDLSRGLTLWRQEVEKNYNTILSELAA